MFGVTCDVWYGDYDRVAGEVKAVGPDSVELWSKAVAKIVAEKKPGMVTVNLDHNLTGNTLDRLEVRDRGKRWVFTLVRIEENPKYLT